MNALSDLAPSETSAPIDSDPNASLDPNPSTPVPTTLDAFGLAQAIAAQLKGATPWTAKPVTDSEGDIARNVASIVRSSDGASLHVRVGGYHQQGRVSFSADWPRYATGDGYNPKAYLSITCSAARTPSSLARDVERPLLSEFEPRYAEALEFVHKADAAAAAARSAAVRIARAVGVKVPDPNESHPSRSNGAVGIFGYLPCVRNLEVVTGWENGPTVAFDVRGIDEPLALRLLALIAESSRGPHVA